MKEIKEKYIKENNRHLDLHILFPWFLVLHNLTNDPNPLMKTLYIKYSDMLEHGINDLLTTQ